MKQMQKYLNILELQHIPDMPDLQKNFNRLLKEYHPDRNRDREDWANDRTRQLIEALHKIKDHIEFAQSDKPGPIQHSEEPEDRSHYNSYSYSYSADDNEEVFQYNGFKGETMQNPDIPVQLLKNGNQNYILLLKSIVKVVHCNPNHLKKVMGRYFYMYDNNIYNLTGFENESADPYSTEYIILYQTSEKNIGFAASGNVKFTRTDKISAKEIIYRKNQDGEILEASVFQDIISYKFPSLAAYDLRYSEIGA
jgi:hypothetical protein